jgi:hypothetical protein
MSTGWRRHACAGTIVALIGVAGCSSCARHRSESRSTQAVGALPSATGSAAVKTAKSLRALFVYANAQRERAALPARFAAALPASEAQLQNRDGHPPLGQVRVEVCSGNELTLRKVLTALQQASKRRALSEALSERYGELFQSCSDPRPCPWLIKTLPTEKDSVVQRVLWNFAAECGQSAKQLIHRRDSPDPVVVRWYFENGIAGIGRRNTEPSSLTPRFADAARATVKQQRGRGLRELAVALGKIDDPKVFALIRTLTKELDPASGAWLAVGLGGHPLPAAKALHRTACQHPEVASDPLCGQEPSVEGAPEPSEPYERLLNEIDGSQAGFGDWLRRHPQQRGEAASLLGICLEKARTLDRYRCLDKLAALDWEKARQASRDIPDTESPDWLELRAALRAFASGPELSAKLQALAAIEPKSAPRYPELLPSAHPRIALAAHDKIHSFDVETGSFPNEHDVLLLQLSVLAGAELRNVIFEEVAPRVDSQQMPGVASTTRAPDFVRAPYRLRAYRDGMRYEVTARNLGDWYDLEAVLGLLNALLRDARSELRYVALATRDQMADVIVGRMALIEDAVRSGWLRPGALDSARAEGTAAEKRVFEQLAADGGAPQRDIAFPHR